MVGATIIATDTTTTTDSDAGLLYRDLTAEIASDTG
jgi:hypothetical protein